MNNISINYIIGDATAPNGNGNKLILHCCNDLGYWGAGFVLALSRKWLRPEEAYRSQFKEREDVSLGDYEIVKVESDIAVVNIIGQRGIRAIHGIPPVRYDAIERAFDSISRKLVENKTKYPEKIYSIHAPRIGCGLAGGKWEIIEKLFIKCFVDRGISVTIYDLPVDK